MSKTFLLQAIQFSQIVLIQTIQLTSSSSKRAESTDSFDYLSVCLSVCLSVSPLVPIAYHSVSSLDCIHCPYRANRCQFLMVGQPQCEVVHRWLSLMSSSLLHQQYPNRLLRLTQMVCVMGGKWLYNCYFERCATFMFSNFDDWLVLDISKMGLSFSDSQSLFCYHHY